LKIFRFKVGIPFSTLTTAQTNVELLLSYKLLDTIAFIPSSGKSGCNHFACSTINAVFTLNKLCVCAGGQLFWKVRTKIEVYVRIWCLSADSYISSKLCCQQETFCQVVTTL